MANNRRLLILLTGWAAFSLFFAAWLWFSWGGLTTTQRFDDLGEFVIAFVAAAACVFTALRHRGRTRLAWALLAASAFSWGVGEVFWSYFELVKGQQVPFPSFADLGYLTAVPLAVAGVLLFPAAPSKVTSLARTVLDALMIGGSLLIISWSTVLHAVYQASSGSLLSDLITLAYPIGDVVICTLGVIFAAPAAMAERLPLDLSAGRLVVS